MSDTYHTTAVFTDEKTLVLDEALPIVGGRVKITLEPLDPTALSHPTDFLARLRAIHDTLFQAGFVPPTREAVDRELERLRSEWDD